MVSGVKSRKGKFAKNQLVEQTRQDEEEEKAMLLREEAEDTVDEFLEEDIFEVVFDCIIAKENAILSAKAQEKAVKRTVWSLCALVAAISIKTSKIINIKQVEPDESSPGDVIDRMAPLVTIRPRSTPSTLSQPYTQVHETKNYPMNTISFSGIKSGDLSLAAGASEAKAIMSSQYLELFRRADVNERGTITVEELHEWLTIQNTISMAKVKKLVQVFLLNEKTEQKASKSKSMNSKVVEKKMNLLGPALFAQVLHSLQAKEPTKWAQKRLTVYALKSDEGSKDEMNQAEKALLLRTTISPGNEKDREARMASLTDADAFPYGESSNNEAKWARSKITTSLPGNITQPASSSYRSNDNSDPDRLLGIAAQVRIHNLHNDSSPNHHEHRFSATSTSSSAGQRPLSAHLVQPHTSKRRLSGNKYYADLCQPATFAPRLSTQMPLLDCPLFLPEAGVNATECLITRLGSKTIKQASRNGPRIPPEINHMTRDHYLNLAQGNLRVQPSTNKKVQQQQTTGTPTKPKHLHKVPQRCSSAHQARNKGGGGKVVVDRQDLLMNLVVQERRPQTAFSGARRIETTIKNSISQDQKQYEELQRYIRDIEANTIGDVKLGLVPSKSLKAPPRRRQKQARPTHSSIYN